MTADADRRSYRSKQTNINEVGPQHDIPINPPNKKYLEKRT